MSRKVGPRLAIAGLLATISIAPPSGARAQSAVTLVPSVSVSTIHDDNLFGTTGSADQLTLLTPGIEGLFDTPVVKVLGLYSFDMQRSIDHPTLNNIEARRHAVFNTAFRESPKVTLTADGTYDRTDTAGELIFGTGLLLERRRAWRWGIGPSIAYQTSPLTSLSAQYTWTNEGIEGTPAADEHVARAGIARRVSPRGTVSLGYLGRHFVNDTDVRTSHAALFGWTYQVGPFATLTLQGGPRLSSRGGLAPEVVAALARKVSGLVVAGVDYWRGESITLGVRGPVEVNSATAKVTWPVLRKVQMGVFGGFFNSTTISQGRARVYHGNLVASWTPRGPLVISASYGADFQRGDVRTSLLSDQTVTRHVFLLRLTVAPRLSRSFHPEDPLQPLLGGPSNGANR